MKTVILAVPYLFGLDKCIEKNLRFLGYEVINLCYDDRDSYYPNLWSRVKSFYYRKVKKDANYKKYLKYSRYQQDIAQKLAPLQKVGKKADYALCIRANIYPKEIIAKIRENSEFCVNYQWDGIDRFPDILEYLSYFDRFLVFDPTDIQKYPQHNFQQSHNFYFDFPLEQGNAYTQETSSGLYFLGGFNASRAQDTKLFIDTARVNHLPLDFHILSQDNAVKKLFGTEGVNYLTRETALSFEQNLSKIAHCLAVVDFVSSDHQGLSFRVFDALCYNKKLITSNKTIMQYPFYHPNNILVWDEEAPQKLKEFLQLPYVPLEPSIRESYSFTQWLAHTLVLAS